MSGVRVMTLAEFHAALAAQGVPQDHVAVKCPVCGTVQSFADMWAAHVAADPARLRSHFHDSADPDLHFGHSCVGRYRGAGSAVAGAAPGQGCDWTLGGFLHAHRLLITMPDGEQVPAFEPATPQEAQAHYAEQNPPTAQSVTT